MSWACSLRRRITAAQRIYAHMTDDNGNLRCGARPLETRRGGRVPGPVPQRGPTQATGGPRAPFRGGARRRVTRVNATGKDMKREEKPKPLTVMQWNAEGISKKKIPLAERLHKEKVDIAVIQETHLTDNMRFSVRGYETYRGDRHDRHKGGVLFLVKNDLIANHAEIDTKGQAEITYIDVTAQDKQIRIYNLYCPDNRELSLETMHIGPENCMVCGDLNSHSQSWGYDEQDARGEEVEEWQVENHLQLLNNPDDPPTYYSRRWRTTTTPDLTFVTNDLIPKAERTVLEQLGGSDHKPIKITLDLNYHPEDCNTLPRWNYKKAKWEEYSMLTNVYTAHINTRRKDTNNMVKDFNEAAKRAAAETIPRGARKEYRPYWTEELQDLEDKVNEARTKVEEEPTEENNVHLKAITAAYRKTYIQAARNNWQKKTEGLNFEKDGNKLWKLARAMNDEKTSRAPIILQQDGNFLTGKKAADHMMDSFEKISNITVPEERRREVQEELRNLQNTSMEDQEEAEEGIMSQPFTEKELEEGLKQLKKEKSPGPDDITNELLTHLGPSAKKILLQIFNTSWKHASVPQIWREATMIPIHKQGKDKRKATSYRPISLTSCVGKLMERLINTRLMWHLEKEDLITPEQAGFRQCRSTEDQVAFIAQKIEDALQDKTQTISIWLDLEKAFDKVWKEGLRLKLRRCGIRGQMYKWICQYLTNRKATVQNRRQRSKKKTLKGGVPQGGVLSPTLFIIFMNDVLKGMPKWIHGAIYADDLVIWCSEQYLTTATVRIQEALKKIEEWTRKWLVSLNAQKTTYTIFSLSTRKQAITLSINGHRLPEDKSPTYLGVTFDPRMTWKNQIDRCTKRAKLRMSLMKKLSGTTWGADYKIQKKLYTGRIRPLLEYGIASWGTAAKSKFEQANKVQNQASRIITGAVKSTPIQSMETLTGLESLESRKDTKVLLQSAKFKRLEDHPMHSRMNQPTKCRLKRESFLHVARRLERQDPDLMEQETAPISIPGALPVWKRKEFPEIRQSIPGILQKEVQSEAERKALTLEYISQNYPAEEWTHVYTDGSAEEATRNGGGGIVIFQKDGTTIQKSIPTGKFSTNYKAEAEALKEAVNMLWSSLMLTGDTIHRKIVIFSDALSVLQALSNPRNQDESGLATALSMLHQSIEKMEIQWIPSHCNIQGNENADRLAKDGGKMPQESQMVTYGEIKTIVKEKQRRRWLQQHPNYNPKDGYYQLSREDQVIMVRLRTGHCRLRHHMFTKFRIGETSVCHCGTADMTVEHLLQHCPLHQNLRAETWPADTPVREKIFGPVQGLRRTAAFIRNTGVPV